jgi:hypothetical protein
MRLMQTQPLATKGYTTPSCDTALMYWEACDAKNPNCLSADKPNEPGISVQLRRPRRRTLVDGEMEVLAMVLLL